MIGFEISRLIKRKRRSKINEIRILCNNINDIATFKEISENNWSVSASIALDDNREIKSINKDGFHSQEEASEYIRKYILNLLITEMEHNRG